MKIDPSSEYDRLLYEAMKVIDFQLREKNGNQIYFTIQTKPFNKNLYATQIILDRLMKLGLAVYEDKDDVVDDVQIGEDDHYHALGIKMTVVDVNLFDRIYSKYRYIFQNNGKDKLIISKKGRATFISEGVTYVGSFKPKSNLYFSLLKLAEDNSVFVSAEDLNDSMTKTKLDSNSNDPIERSRQAIKNIKKKFNYKGKRLIKSNYDSYKLLPEVEIVS